MIPPEELIPFLKGKIAEVAQATVSTPLEYGAYRQNVGTHAAYTEILHYIEGLLNDADERDRSL